MPPFALVRARYELALLAGWLAAGGAAARLDAPAAVVRRGASRLRPLGARSPRSRVGGARCGTRARRSASPARPTTSRAALGGERRTAHFVLHYSPTGPYAKDIAAYAEDDEFRWHELEQLLRRRAGAAGARVPLRQRRAEARAHGRRRTPSSPSRGGARSTCSTTPWPQDGHQARAGARVRRARSAIRSSASRAAASRFNVGLIEGVAVAAAWPLGRAGADAAPEASRCCATPARRRAHARRGDGARLLRHQRRRRPTTSPARSAASSSTRAAPASSRRIYRAAGARRQLARRLRRRVRHAARRVAAAVDAEVVPPAERAVALERLEQPSVFRRVCAHAQALRKQAAREAAQAGDRARAIAEWNAVCRDDDSPEQRARSLEALRRRRRPRAAAQAALARARATSTHVHRARALMLAATRGAARRRRRLRRASAALPLDEATGAPGDGQARCRAGR